MNNINYFFSGVTETTGTITSLIYGTEYFFIETKPVYKIFDIKKKEDIAQKRFSLLQEKQKHLVYGKIWELGKLKDTRICGDKWGEKNVLEDNDRLLKALYRLGFLENKGLCRMTCLALPLGTGNFESQYFSLGEKLGQDPKTGEIGLVNGIRYESLEKAGKDASAFSESFASGKNIHCVYMPTYGLLKDVGILKAVDGGSFVKTTYLIVQQWIEFLDSHTDKKYLQVGYSGGGTQVNAALRFTQENRPDLLERICVLNFCSAHLILPETYPGVQVINFFKKNDLVVMPVAVNGECVGDPRYAKNLKEVIHTKDDPHNYLSEDFVKEGKPYVNNFIESGYLY